MRARVADSLSCFFSDVTGDEGLQGPCTADHRAEVSRSEQVVANPVPLGQAQLSREISLRVEKIDCGNLWRIGHLQCSVGEGFVQKPGAPGGPARWYGA